MTMEPSEGDQMQCEMAELKQRVAHLERVLSNLHVTLAKTLTYASHAARVAVEFEYVGKDSGMSAWREMKPLEDEIDSRLLEGVKVLNNE